MNKKTQKHNNNAGNIVAVGAGIAALSAAAYVLFGPEGKKNRKVIRGWAIKMKGEVIERLETARNITEPVYHDIIDTVAEKYAKVKHIDTEELANAVDELRKQWKHMARDAKQKNKKVAKKTSKKSVSKTKKKSR